MYKKPVDISLVSSGREHKVQYGSNHPSVGYRYYSGFSVALAAYIAR